MFNFMFYSFCVNVSLLPLEKDFYVVVFYNVFQTSGVCGRCFYRSCISCCLCSGSVVVNVCFRAVAQDTDVICMRLVSMWIDMFE